MGEIWRAHHKFLVRPAAVKLIRPEMIGADDSDAVARAAERFEREAQVTATLESPHTVELFDFGVADDGTFYYVMELLDGVDLDRMVRDHGPLPAGRVVHLLRQACDSLDDAHGHGLVHRDIKPANLVVVPRRGRRRDFLKILDFGLVKGDPRGDDAPLTSSGVAEVKGTPAFLAPEMVTGHHDVDGRADLYALACVGCWMLTGGYLFDADSAMAMAIAHATEPPVGPSKRGASVPAELEELLLRCLSKDPADRPATAGELADRLAALPVAPWTEADADAWWRGPGGEPTGDAGAPATPAAGETRVA
jgi:serine/threonine-protein kinase